MPTDTRHMAHASRAVRWAAASRLLSWLAGLAGLGFVALFLVQAGLFRSLEPKPAAEQPAVANPEQITSIDSTVTGLDSQNQPYEVKARRGSQDKDKPNIIYLDDLDATFRRPSGEAYVLTAKTGVYDSKTKGLDVEGSVVISENGRFTARMDKARILIKNKNLTSDVPVRVEMKNGDTIAANGMKITDDGARILFLNGVKATFGGETAKGDASP